MSCTVSDTFEHLFSSDTRRILLHLLAAKGNPKQRSSAGAQHLLGDDLIPALSAE
jgi:hypothetical protein